MPTPPVLKGGTLVLLVVVALTGCASIEENPKAAIGGLGGATVGGLIAAAYYGSVSVVMGVMMGLKGLTAAIVGGIGNPRGALLGGLIVALIESFAAGYFFAAYKEVAVFALLILLLIFRPEGLFGEP